MVENAARNPTHIARVLRFCPREKCLERWKKVDSARKPWCMVTPNKPNCSKRESPLSQERSTLSPAASHKLSFLRAMGRVLPISGFAQINTNSSFFPMALIVSARLLSHGCVHARVQDILVWKRGQGQGQKTQKTHQKHDSWLPWL